jgi:hypothetical protein
MSYLVKLPEDTEQLEKVLSSLVGHGKLRRNPQAVRWLLTHWYMRGARNFTKLDYEAGLVQVGYYDDAGKLQFIYEDILAKYQTQMGRMMGIDLRPAVKKQDTGLSLDGLRKASIAQVVLDAIVPAEKARQLKCTILPPFLQYGTVGLGVWFENEDSMGVEVIMPWELLPIPTNVSDPSEIRGIARVRWLPVQWIEQLPFIGEAEKEILKTCPSVDVPTSDLPAAVQGKFQGVLATQAQGAAFYTQYSPSNLQHNQAGGEKTSPGKDGDKSYMKIVEFAEFWTMTSNSSLAEYLVTAGGKKMYRTDHSKTRVEFPIHIARDITVGGFWGRSYAETLMPMNNELEWAISRTLQNISELSLYGILMTPTTSGFPDDIMEGSDGLRRARYEIDYTAPEQKPFNIEPVNHWPALLNVLKVAYGLYNNLANQPTELMKGDAPGRVDSSTALGFLNTMSNVPLSPGAASLSTAMVGCYRALLGMARDHWSSGKLVEVTSLDDCLAGAVLDRATGKLKLADNAIPSPAEVQITVASEMPASPEQKKMELAELLKTAVITPYEYRIAARRENLDLPVANEVEWQNYRRAMYNNLMVFGDGQKPGEVLVSEFDMSTVHLKVIDAFMARPEFTLASKAVWDKFALLRKQHQANLGKLPEGMPYMEENAIENQQMMDMQNMTPPGQQAYMSGQGSVAEA